MVHIKITCLFLSNIASYLLLTSPVTAQIFPDTSLPNNSRITTDGNNNVISGGTQAGTNLFHIFQQLSVPIGSTAYFNNSLDIQNILSRVTGDSVSLIDGLIRANGAANLFLLNRNGIIFGSNARLNIGGSFIASTASSLNFADKTQFNTVSPQPVLTVSVPIGLGFGSNAGEIIVQGSGAIRNPQDPTGRLLNPQDGLSVQSTETLALVSNGLTLEGGILSTNGGRIELGSVDNSSTVNLSPVSKGWALSYSDVQKFADIQLYDRTAVDASGTGGGNIEIEGRQLILTDGSQIENSILGDQPGEALRVTTSDSIELVGSNAATGIGFSILPGATGAGSELTIETRQLRLRDGAQVAVANFGNAPAGSLTVKASDSVELTGISPNGQFPTAIGTSVERGATATGGNLIVETRQLSLRNGARMQVDTAGIGSAGNLTIKASDLVELIGVSSINSRFGTNLSNPVLPGATGAGGNLIIETRQLHLQDGAQIITPTFGSAPAGNLAITSELVELIGTTPDGQFPTAIGTASQRRATGEGGNLNIATKRLSVRGGAQIGTSTSSLANAGDLTVKARNLIELSGTTPDGERPSAISTRTTGSGDAGNLIIETQQLNVQDGARVTVSSEGTGKAGQLQVQTNSMALDNGAKLIAETFSGDGGDIKLQVASSLQMRRNSQISTTATNTGNGGNITIITGTLAG